MEVYFVSYNVQSEKAVGFGNVEMRTNEKISNIQDLKDIARSIEENDGLDFQSVVVMNYKHLRTE